MEELQKSPGNEFGHAKGHLSGRCSVTGCVWCASFHFPDGGKL